MGSPSKLFKSLSSTQGLLGTFTGGLLGTPNMPNMPKAPKEAKTQIDPNYGAQVAAAKRRKLASAGAANRQSFRIDLSTGDAAANADGSRSGIVI